MRTSGGRRRNAAEIPTCEICQTRTVWVSRVPKHIICRPCEPLWRERQQRARQAKEDAKRSEIQERGHELDVAENPGDWEELDGVHAWLHSDRSAFDAMWAAVGHGDMREALLILDGAEWDVGDATEVKASIEPDDMLGEIERIWVR